MSFGPGRFWGLIDPYAPAGSAPPLTVAPFFRWALSGAWRAIFLAMLITATAGATELVSAWFTGWVIDQASARGQSPFWATYWPLVVAGVAYFLILRPIVFAADAGITSILLGPHLFPLVLSRLNKHTLGHSMRYFENDFAGRISQKAMQTARGLTDVVVEVSDVFVYGLAMFAGALILMAGIDARLLLGMVVWGSLYAVALIYFIPRVQLRSAKRAGARTVVTGQIVDTLSNIGTVKLFAHDTFEEKATLRALEDLRCRSLEFGWMSAGFRLVIMSLGGILPLFAITGSLYLWTLGQATVGDIAMTAMIATRLAQITNRLSNAAVSVFTNIGEIEDGIATLAPAHEIVDRANALDETVKKGAITYEDVRFTYGGQISALKGFDLTIPQGCKLALVGASGAGKSTVVSLLLRLYDVEGGRILLGDHDIRDLTQTALRQQISVVRQETSMFNRSALENIRYGRPEATDEEVFEAARKAAAHDFILTLRDHRGREGYAARLGERGVKLSGGQRQRIALARAMLKDAPILVLDEATSALDSEVEAEIQSALEVAMRGKTVIAIAHRLSTIARMDRILVLDAGKIFEDGTHTQLLAQDGLYARYWNCQSGGFLGAQAAAE